MYSLHVMIYNYRRIWLQNYYEDRPEERDLSPMERALRRYLQKQQGQSPIRTSLYHIMAEDAGQRTSEEAALRRELSKFVRAADSTNDIVLMKPRTLAAFLEDDKDKKRFELCKGFRCSFLFLGKKGNNRV